MRKRDQKAEGFKIEKKVFPTKERKDEDMVRIYFLLNGDKVLNITYVPASQAKDWQLKKEL